MVLAIALHLDWWILQG